MGRWGAIGRRRRRLRVLRIYVSALYTYMKTGNGAKNVSRARARLRRSGDERYTRTHVHPSRVRFAREFNTLLTPAVYETQ